MENALGDIHAENWLPADAAWLASLRTGFGVMHGIVLIIASFFAWLLPYPAAYFCFAIIALCLGSFFWFCLVWAPKTCARTRYLVREKDINLQKGFMFWKLVSVSFNRIQHLEVRQGPIERAYGLATLVIFTAGTFASDLQIPGLSLVNAQQLKSQLLNNINTEDVNDLL